MAALVFCHLGFHDGCFFGIFQDLWWSDGLLLWFATPKPQFPWGRSHISIWWRQGIVSPLGDCFVLWDTGLVLYTIFLFGKHYRENSFFYPTLYLILYALSKNFWKQVEYKFLPKKEKVLISQSIVQNGLLCIHWSCLWVSECCFKDLSFACFNSYYVMVYIFAEWFYHSPQGREDFR